MKRKNEDEGAAEQVVEQPTFTKEQIMGSQKFMHMTDVVSAALTDGESYTMDKVDDLIQEFMKGEVN